MFFGLSRSCWTSFDQDWMFTEGQSTIALVFSFRSFVRWFIMSAVFSASRRFRFVCSSICFGDEVTMWWVKFGRRDSAIVFLCVGDRSLESFAFRAFILCSFCSSIITPARVIGPITGPLPASSIPRSFIV